MSATSQGAVVIDGTLDAIGGGAFKTVFDGMVEEPFEADWADAKDRLGRDPLSSELARVVTGLEALAGGLAELWDETPLWARQLARILEQDPDLERYVYGPGEIPIAYNERDRFFSCLVTDGGNEPIGEELRTTDWAINGIDDSVRRELVVHSAVRGSADVGAVLPCSSGYVKRICAKLTSVASTAATGIDRSVDVDFDQ